MEEANRCIEATRPWELAAAERGGDAAAGARLDGVLTALLDACRRLAVLLEPFVPGVAARIGAQCAPSGGVLPPARPVFARLGESGGQRTRDSSSSSLSSPGM